jgi:MFS family permease
MASLTAPPPALSLRRNSHFNLFWASQGFDALGDSFAKIALPLLVLERTGSISRMGLVTALMGCGSLAACVSSGFYIDRLDRLRLMVACDMGRALFYLLMPVALQLAGQQLWPLYVLAAATAYLNSLFLITHTAAVPSLVPADQLTAANARLQTTFGLSYVLGPLLAGAGAGWLGSQKAVGLTGVLYALSLLLMLLVRPQFKPEATPQPQGSSWKELLGGVRFILRHPVLRQVALLFALFAFFSEATVDLTIFRLGHELRQSQVAIGLVFGVASLGAIAAGLSAQKLRRRWGFQACFLASLVLQSVAMAGIGLAPGTWGLGAMALVFTLGLMLRNINTMSYRQEVTPAHLLGRVSAAFWTLIAVLGPLGVVAATTLAESLGVSRVLLGMGLLGVTVAGLGAALPARRARGAENREILR